MFDSHCHLTDLDAPEDALDAARAAGVRGLLTCGYDAASNRLVCALSEQLPSLPYAVGLHPWFAGEDVDSVVRLIASRRPNAVGEAGLDLWGDPPCQPIERQVHVLEAQLQIAVELDLPVTLHSRKAVDVLLSVLRNHPGVRGALHAFSGSYEQARPFLDLGMFIGVGGAVTRSRAKRVRRCASAVPLERILLETDAPAIGMAVGNDVVEPPHVRPAHLVHVRDALATLRGISPEHVEQATDANASSLFGVPLP